MLIGVLVEVVSVTAQVDKEETAMKVVWSWVIESWDPVSTSHIHADGAREYLTPQNKVYICVYIYMVAPPPGPTSEGGECITYQVWC